MPIPALKPIVVPAKPATPYNDVWLGSWVITRKTPQDKGSVSISESYYNAELDQVHPNESERSAGSISTTDLADAVENVPEVKAAYGALLAAAEPLRAYLIQKKEAAKAARKAATDAARAAFVAEAAPVETVSDGTEPEVVVPVAGNPESVIPQ